MKGKKLLAMFLCIVMLLSSVPVLWAANAADEVFVRFLFANGDDMQTVLKLTVQDGTAERYGYTVAEKDHNGVPVETVTVMDVLVAAHAYFYGDEFTAQTATDYLVIGNGFLEKAFGIETTSMGFTIDGAMPHDDKYIETAYGGYYTGYAADTARVVNANFVTLFLYKDKNWMDMQTQITAPVLVNNDQKFTVSLRGYSIMPYGCDKQEAIERNTKPLAGVTLECTQDFKTFTTLGTFDAKGDLEVSLPEDGTYYLVARGVYHDATGDVPLIANYHEIGVGDVNWPFFLQIPLFPLYVPVFMYPKIYRVGSDLQVSLMFRCIDIYGFSRETVKLEIPLFTIPMQWLFGLFER